MATQRQQIQRDYQQLLHANPVFTLDQLATVARGRDPRQTARERVKYYLATGRLLSLARGLYAVVPHGVDSHTFVPDPFLAMAAFRPDAVFSHHSALQLLGAAHSTWNVCTACTTGAPARLLMSSQTLRVLRAPVPRMGAAWNSLGVQTVVHLGRPLRVTGPERTLVEGFRQPRWVGGPAELVESAAGFASLDLDLLRSVLVVYEQRSLWSAVGWFLERHAREFHVDPGVLHDFAQHRPKSTHYLLRGTRGGAFASRWNLILPPELVAGGGSGEPYTPCTQ